MKKIEGSGSGSISQRHGSADPDPDPPQNVMDPQYWFIDWRYKQSCWYFRPLLRSNAHLTSLVAPPPRVSKVKGYVFILYNVKQRLRVLKRITCRQIPLQGSF
jgi:hypothetical protein